MLKKFYPKYGRKKEKVKPSAGTTVQVPKVVYKPPVLTTLNQFKATEGEFLLELTDDTFLVLLQNLYLDTTPQFEQAGYGVIEDGRIVYLVDANDGARRGPGAVTSDFGAARKKAIKGRETRPFNLQYHTHPDFSTFFSGTDTADQNKTLKDLMQNTPSGVFYFAVFNQLENLCHRFEWADGVGVSRHTGSVGWKGVPFHFAKTYYGSYRFVDSTKGTTKTKGSNGKQPSVWDGYDDDDYWLSYYDQRYPTQSAAPALPATTEGYYEKLFRLMDIELWDFKALKDKVTTVFGKEAYHSLLNKDMDMLDALEDYLLLDKEYDVI